MKKLGLDRSFFDLLLPLFLLIGCTAENSKFQATHDSTREAIVRGEIRQALSVVEAQALEAEQNKKWEEAAEYYRHAAMLARTSGHLQKAIGYGNKTLEMAEKFQHATVIQHASSQIGDVFFRPRGLLRRYRTLRSPLTPLSLPAHCLSLRNFAPPFLRTRGRSTVG